MAGCHQLHGVNGEEVGAGSWQDSRVQPLLAANQCRGGKTLLCMREIMLASKPIIPKFKKKFSTKLCFYLWILNGRLFTQLSRLQKPGQLKQYAGSSPPSNQKLLAQRRLNQGTNLLGAVFQGTPKQQPECKSSCWGMALWQMKTLIRDGRVSMLFFFNPYPGAFAGPPCLCLCAKKFPASLCNKILFGERSNKATMWAHHSQRTLPPV